MLSLNKYNTNSIWEQAQTGYIKPPKLPAFSVTHIRMDNLAKWVDVRVYAWQCNCVGVFLTDLSYINENNI